MERGHLLRLAGVLPNKVCTPDTMQRATREREREFKPISGVISVAPLSSSQPAAADQGALTSCPPAKWGTIH